MRILIVTMFIIASVALLTITLEAYAHRGRTDSNGGHRDRVTGDYHYHSGGRRSSRGRKSSSIRKAKPLSTRKSKSVSTKKVKPPVRKLRSNVKVRTPKKARKLKNLSPKVTRPKITVPNIRSTAIRRISSPMSRKSKSSRKITPTKAVIYSRFGKGFKFRNTNWGSSKDMVRALEDAHLIMESEDSMTYELSDDVSVEYSFDNNRLTSAKIRYSNVDSHRAEFFKKNVDTLSKSYNNGTEVKMSVDVSDTQEVGDRPGVTKFSKNRVVTMVFEKSQ